MAENKRFNRIENKLTNRVDVNKEKSKILQFEFNLGRRFKRS